MNARLTLLGLALLTNAAGHACAGVSLDASQPTFRGQSNIIVWDPIARTQHFIRHAKFKNNRERLGFIAPGPTVPELAEADPEVFKVLSTLQTEFVGKPRGGGSRGSSLASGVQVLKVQSVAGYQAVVLRAKDAVGLEKWLRENDFVVPPDVRKWLEFYIKKNWVFTAFKVDVVQGSGETGLVRMSFEADKPFNPYLVPASNIGDESEGLALHFISNGVYEAENVPEKSWFGKQWRSQIPEIEAKLIERHLGVKLPKNPVVTFFQDPQFPNRHAVDDITFRLNAYDTAPVPDIQRPLDLRLWVGLGTAAALGASAAFWVSRSRRRSN